MAKLLLVVDESGVDHLIVLVPDDYAETEIEATCFRQDMKEPLIHEIDIDEDQAKQLKLAGMKDYREYWG